MVPGARSAHGNRTRRAPAPPAPPARPTPSTPSASGNSSTSPRALCSAGTRSGSTPSRRSASAVAGPTAATSTPPRARASRNAPMKRSTALTEVSTTQRLSCTDAAAAASAAPPSAGSTCRVRGNSRAVAPARSNASTSPRARPAARVTTTVRPANGPPDTAGESWRPRAATGPTTMTAGGPRSTSANPASVVRATRWDAVVPEAMTATAVSGGRPPCISAAAIAARFVMPMRITSVPPTRANASQSCSPVPSDPPTRPVTTVTEAATPRWVTGMPAAAGTPKADVTPGTTSQATPASASASTSSPPRPKRKGSPPLSRTTTADARPCSTSRRAISSWRPAPPAGVSGSLPTSMTSADDGTRSRTAGLTSRSCSTTSARASNAAPRLVRSPGSPGPAPTR